MEFQFRKWNSNFHFCISFFYSIKNGFDFSFSFSYDIEKNEKSNFRFSFFKNEIPNGSETDVHPEIVNEKKKKNDNNNNQLRYNIFPPNVFYSS